MTYTKSKPNNDIGIVRQMIMKTNLLDIYLYETSN